MIISRNQRATPISKYAIEVDGAHGGWVREVDGGHAVGDVVAEKVGADHLAKKHIGNVSYEELTFKCGTGMSKGIYDWIHTGFNQTSIAAGRKNGAVIFADYDQMEVSRLNWQNGLISEFGMPALDAASKDAAMMTVKFKPEITRKVSTGGGAKINAPIQAKVQKQWLPSNFKLEIEACNCTRVNKIEALTIKQKITANAVGEMRDYEQEPTSVEVPNLVISMAESHADDFFKWHEDFVIKGHCQEGNEKTGTLHYLAADLVTELFTLTFFNLGVFKISPDKVEAGGEPIRRVKVEMYCEHWDWVYGPGATWQG